MANFFLPFLRRFFRIVRPETVAIRARNPETRNTEWRPLLESVRFVIIMKVILL